MKFLKFNFLVLIIISIYGLIYLSFSYLLVLKASLEIPNSLILERLSKIKIGLFHQFFIKKCKLSYFSKKY